MRLISMMIGIMTTGCLIIDRIGDITKIHKKCCSLQAKSASHLLILSLFQVLLLVGRRELVK